MREIIKRAQNVLESSGYDYCDYSGCFDIAAKRSRKFMLLKILGNVDSIQEEQANSLKIISRNLDATAVIVGERTRREELEDGVIYKRFDIPTMTMETLENAFGESRPLVTRARGGLFVEIDAQLLKKRRQASGLTQAALAKKAGTTKKSVYEHEKENKKAPLETAEKIESILGPVSASFSAPVAKDIAETKPRGQFETAVSRHFRSIGFETSIVYQAPFNIMAKTQETIILSEAEENREKIEKLLDDMISFSRLFHKPIIAITRGEAELTIPTIEEKELRNYSAKDIKKLAKKW